jgi:antitoxin (DNA-binding transcriptional repressor) of toxin-antitoxin stability system
LSVPERRHRRAGRSEEIAFRADFQTQQCLAIINEVAETHQPVAISKRGKPMARLVPAVADEEIECHILARLRAGEGGMRVDENMFLEPSSRIAGWSEVR